MLPLADGRYLQVTEALEHPVTEKMPYGQAVRARSEDGGGWFGWVVSVPDMMPIERRVGHKAIDGAVQMPTGEWIRWRQLGMRGMIADPQLPYFIKWEFGRETMPDEPKPIRLIELIVVGARLRVEQWLGTTVSEYFDGVRLNFSSQSGQPGIAAAIFETDDGLVRI
jgi:hypothetical protein